MPAGMGVAQAIIYIRAVDMVTRPLTGMSRSVARFGMAISQVGLAMSAAISFPVAAAIKGIADASIEFDKQMRQFQSISKQTDAEIATLGSRLIAMSTDIKQTVAPAAELSKAMYEIQSASFTAGEAEKILSVSTKLASATLSDQEETAATLSTVINSYGRNIARVGEFADIMARGIDIGVFKMGDLNQSLGEITSLAYDLGVPFSELIATLTTMTKKGVGFSESVTSMRRVMMAYLKPAQKEIELGKKYGIILSGNTIRTKGLAGAIEELVKNTGGDVDIMANIIGEMRAIRGVMAIGTGGGLDMVSKDMATLGHAVGSVQQIYETMSKSVAFQIENLKNKFNALAIKLGAIVIPMLIKIVDKVGELVDKFSNSTPTMQRFAVMFAIVAAAIGPVLIAVGQFIAFVGPIVSIIGSVGGAVASVAGGILVMIGLFETWQNKISVVRETMDELATKPGFLGGLTASVTTLFTELDKAGGVSDTFHTALDGIAKTWNEMPAKMNISWAAILAGALKLLAFLIITVSNNIIGAGIIISNVVDRIIQRVGVMGYYVESQLNELSTYLSDVGLAVNESGSDAFGEMGASIKKMADDVVAALGRVFEEFRVESNELYTTPTGFDLWLDNAWAFIGELAGPVVEGNKKAFTDLANSIGTGLALAVAFLEHTIDNIAALVGVIGALIKSAGAMATLDMSDNIAAANELAKARAEYDKVRGRSTQYYLDKAKPADTSGVAGANQALAQSAKLASESIRGMAGAIPKTITPPAAGMAGSLAPDLKGVAGAANNVAQAAKTVAGSAGASTTQTNQAAKDFAASVAEATEKYRKATANLPVLNDPRWDTSAENKKFLEDMAALFKMQIDATKGLIGLDLTTPMEDALKAWKILQSPAMGPTSPTGAQRARRDIPGMPSFGTTGWAQLPDFAAQQEKNAAIAKAAADKAAADAANGLGKAADGLTDKFADLKKGIGGVLDEIIGYSENLGDFGLGPGGGNPLLDPNGPFQAIWRIQDVAQHAGAGRSEGPNTKEFAEMYFPGLNMDQAQAAAAEVGRLFKSFQWDKIMQFIGPGYEKVIADYAAQNPGGVPPALQALIDQIAVNSQTGATAGKGKITPPTGKDATKMSESALLKLAAGDVTPEGVKSIIEPAMPVLVTGLKDAIARNESGIRDTGKDFWKQFGEGITKQAETDGNLRKVVEAIVISLLGDKE